MGEMKPKTLAGVIRKAFAEYPGPINPTRAMQFGDEQPDIADFVAERIAAWHCRPAENNASSSSEASASALAQDEPSPFERELLEALKGVFVLEDRLLDDIFGYEWLEQARALITKANSRGKGECTQRDGFANCNFTRTNRLDACHEPGGCLASPPTSKGEG